MLNKWYKLTITAFAVVTLSGCATMQENEALVQGPPISDTVTPFDKALTCLDGRINKKLTFSVGSILDQTGKEQITDGGTGKFVTQGGGDIVQAALFRAGTTVVNRRDPRIMEREIKWGVASSKTIVPSRFYITGSINALDFLPGAGIDASIDGIAPRYRQHRILVGLDLFLTETRSGRIVASVPLQKQIVASEVGLGIGRFFGSTLVSLDMGNKQREAMQFSLRQMLNLATFELLTQVMSVKNYADCRVEIDRAHGFVDHTSTAKAAAAYTATDTEQPAGIVETAIPEEAAGAEAEPGQWNKPGVKAKPEDNGDPGTTGSFWTEEDNTLKEDSPPVYILNH